RKFEAQWKFSSLAETLAQKRIEKDLTKVQEALDAVDAGEATFGQKELQKLSVLEQYSKVLKEADALITATGTVDMVAYGSRFVEDVGKGAAIGMALETIAESVFRLAGSSDEALEYLSEKSTETVTSLKSLIAGVAGSTTDELAQYLTEKGSEAIQGIKSFIPGGASGESAVSGKIQEHAPGGTSGNPAAGAVAEHPTGGASEELVTKEELEKLREEEIAAEEAAGKQSVAEKLVADAGGYEPPAHAYGPAPMEDAPEPLLARGTEASTVDEYAKIRESMPADEYNAKIKGMFDRYQALRDEIGKEHEALIEKINAARAEGSEDVVRELRKEEDGIITKINDLNRSHQEELGRFRFEELHKLPKLQMLEDMIARKEAGILTPAEEGILDNHIKNLSPEELKAIDTKLEGRLAPFGRDTSGLPFSSEQEAKDFEDLRNATHDPRETGAWPGSHPHGAEGSEAVFPIGTLEISPTDAHLYATDSKELFVYGGSWDKQGPLVQQYLEAHPKETVYSADALGKHRIPWSLVDGKVTPGTPVRTGGFLGFGSSWAEAPKPEEFVKIIK
ncbi:MAG: hypothetical protein G01um101449_503, partial [Parcubacteria group bacterium Gr01-1014_49]